ncbi:MAG: STAS domain-containing protein [Pirellulaceae bacterium]|nr:STAS domain-containing protein [Pirellulaceae bacterium]
MTIVSNTFKNVPVVLIAQSRLTDEAALRELCEAIVEQAELAGRKNVVLDFELVEMIGSPSLRMLLRAKSKLQEKEAKLHLCGLRPTVAEVIHTTGFQQLFPVYENVAAAQQTIELGSYPPPLAEVDHEVPATSI